MESDSNSNISSNEVIRNHMGLLLEQAQSNAITYDRYQQIQSKVEGPSEDDEKEIEKSTIIVQTIGEFSLLLSKLVESDPENVTLEEMLSALAHENAHANVAEKAGAETVEYHLLVCKVENTFIYNVWCNFSHPESWFGDKERIRDLIGIFNAPKDYGEVLSEDDIDKITELRKLL